MGKRTLTTEFKVSEITTADPNVVTRWLNEHGNDGWEPYLMTVRELPGGLQVRCTYSYTFRRRKSEHY